MTDQTPHVVTRFAPSPTGFQHIGGMRTALFAWLWARKNNGTFILRIEDTDREREVAGSIEHVQEALRWLGLNWDYGPNTATPFGPCIQSERLDTYREAAQRLIDKGLAYSDPYSAEEVDAFRRQAQAEKRPFLFRDHRPTQTTPWDGSRPLRFKVPEVKRMRWHDAVRGDLEAGEEALDDFVLIKSDGYPTYNFAHIIDDYHMGVTHIMRTDEFISSTPKFLSLYEALEIAPPILATLPPILRDDKTKKLGKRDGAKDVRTYRDEGFLSDAMINFLALIGWNPGTEQEVFSREELIASFDIARIQTHGAVLNEEKLRWLNRSYVHRLSDDDFLDYIEPVLDDSLRSHRDRVRQLITVLKDKMSIRDDLGVDIQSGQYRWVSEDPLLDPTQLVWKESTSEETLLYLGEIRNKIETVPDVSFDIDAIKNLLWDYATEKGRGAVLWPLRYCLTGLTKSPDPFTVASVIGKSDTIHRIDTAIALLSGTIKT